MNEMHGKSYLSQLVLVLDDNMHTCMQQLYSCDDTLGLWVFTMYRKLINRKPSNTPLVWASLQSLFK